jgi:hypothetical protein
LLPLRRDLFPTGTTLAGLWGLGALTIRTPIEDLDTLHVQNPDTRGFDNLCILEDAFRFFLRGLKVMIGMIYPSKNFGFDPARYEPNKLYDIHRDTYDHTSQASQA